MSRQQQQQLSQSYTVSKEERGRLREGEREREKGDTLYIPQTNSELGAKWQTKLTSTMQKSNRLSCSLFLKHLSLSPLFFLSLQLSLSLLYMLVHSAYHFVLTKSENIKCLSMPLFCVLIKFHLILD